MINKPTKKFIADILKLKSNILNHVSIIKLF